MTDKPNAIALSSIRGKPLLRMQSAARERIDGSTRDGTLQSAFSDAVGPLYDLFATAGSHENGVAVNYLKRVIEAVRFWRAFPDMR
jgi:hypothetical protein